eukprot:NODE_2317_length_579_cov_51.598113_g1835_i0.p1 GENE.NODE_2317_length_579_cov_51.598113_g1835_i0~~NODE_2317_length_579_cov_51.598113_g1835_i0.p1  ORF type:complete len:179 (-),score=39.72 NODE_2317_length_579_cov_51.598113_g1835_i0:43-546(-)
MKKKWKRFVKKVVQAKQTSTGAAPETAKKRKRFKVEGSLSGMIICQSGLQFGAAVNREEVERDIVKHGGKITQNPKKCTHLLLCNDGKESRKHKEAMIIGAQVMTYPQIVTAMRGITQKEHEDEAPTKKRKPNIEPATPTPTPTPTPLPVAATGGFRLRAEDVQFRL